MMAAFWCQIQHHCVQYQASIIVVNEQDQPMFTMKTVLVVLALAATASTSASAFIPGTAVKNVVGNAVQKGARFPLVSK